jgi:hypothetical protein
VLLGGQGKDAGPTADDVRQSVQRSLPYLHTEGYGWIKERKCNSCHYVTFGVWGHQEALNAGVKLDAAKFNAFADWSLSYSLSARQNYRLPEDKVLKADGIPEELIAKFKPIAKKSYVTEQEFARALGAQAPMAELAPHERLILKKSVVPKAADKNDGSSAGAVGQLLLGLAGSKHAKNDEFRKSAPTVLARWQEANGSFKAAGQLPRQNRSPAEADEVATAWVLLGLATLDPNDPAVKKVRDAALAYFKKSKPGKTHERHLLQMLIEHRFGDSKKAAPLLKDVIARQNSDGGWASIPGAASDAFATGQTLFALTVVASEERAAIARGQKYLLQAQHKDGHWVVPPKAITDPKSNDVRVQRLVPIYDYWGTAWATIGLARSVATPRREP